MGTKVVVLGSRVHVTAWMREHDLDYNDVITANGMLVGRRFYPDDIVVLDDLAELMQTDRQRDQFVEWVARLNRAVWPGHQAPAELRELLAHEYHPG